MVELKELSLFRLTLTSVDVVPANMLECAVISLNGCQVLMQPTYALGVVLNLLTINSKNLIEFTHYQLGFS